MVEIMVEMVVEMVAQMRKTVTRARMSSGRITAEVFVVNTNFTKINVVITTITMIGLDLGCVS